MNIQSINFNIVNYYPRVFKRNEANKISCTNPIKTEPAPAFDTVSFTGVANGGDILKKLCKYGIPDMYTGQILLDARILEKMENNGFFNFPAEKIVNAMSYYEKCMIPIDKSVFKIIKKHAHKHPNYSLSEILKDLYPVHKKQLLRDQQTIFEEIIRLACDMPKDLYEEFTLLMNITNKRLLNDPVVLPFSEREFLYKLRRIGDGLYIKNNKNEINSMAKLISAANKIFDSENKNRRKYGRNIKKKLELQMQPEILKKNSSNLAKFKQIFEYSSLKNNEDIKKLLDSTSAKIHGFPSFANFERKSFIHELKKITRKLKNKKLAQKFTDLSLRLPTSKDNVSAFIVKYSDQTNNKIGTNIILNSVCSIDHLVAKKNGGHNKLSNYGLCSAEINRQKTDIYFDDWVRKHPETRKNCQKYINRLIELYKQGIFEKVSKNHKNKRIDKSYIEDFAQTIYDISPAENRIRLNISELYE